MKKKICLMAMATAVIFSACTNANEKNNVRKSKDENIHNSNNHNDSIIKSSDTIGMKMGGNELNSIKK